MLRRNSNCCMQWFLDSYFEKLISERSTSTFPFNILYIRLHIITNLLHDVFDNKNWLTFSFTSSVCKCTIYKNLLYLLYFCNPNTRWFIYIFILRTVFVHFFPFVQILYYTTNAEFFKETLWIYHSKLWNRKECFVQRASFFRYTPIVVIQVFIKETAHKVSNSIANKKSDQYPILNGKHVR